MAMRTPIPEMSGFSRITHRAVDMTAISTVAVASLGAEMGLQEAWVDT